MNGSPANPGLSPFPGPAPCEQSRTTGPALPPERNTSTAPDPPEAVAATRRDLLVLAERKRAGGGALVAAGQPAEALGLFRDAMALACRALDPRGDPGAEPAALLAAIHGHLVPAGLLGDPEAGALARAGDAARAFAAVTIAPPDSLVGAIAEDAGALVARARVGVATA